MQNSDWTLYVVLYFAELAKLTPGQNRTFDVYFNGEYSLKMSPIYQQCNEIYGYVAAAAAGHFNLSLAPSKNVSNLPPILNAMELCTWSEVIANETAAQDISGLRRLAWSSDRLARWSEDPCLPVAWQWLECNQENPPRVTALYLAGLNLRYLLDFSDMQALEIIDLQNNSLIGSIPDFFGNFLNLKKLNLANNQLSGVVPQALRNSKISINISGNPNLIIDNSMRMSKSNHIGLIVGLWVAAISVVIGFFIVIFILRRTRGETKVRNAELVMVQVENQADDHVTDSSLEQTENVTAAAEMEREGTVQDAVTVAVNERVAAAEVEDAVFLGETAETVVAAEDEIRIPNVERSESTK